MVQYGVHCGLVRQKRPEDDHVPERHRLRRHFQPRTITGHHVATQSGDGEDVGLGFAGLKRVGTIIDCACARVLIREVSMSRNRHQYDRRRFSLSPSALRAWALGRESIDARCREVLSDR